MILAMRNTSRNRRILAQQRAGLGCRRPDIGLAGGRLGESVINPSRLPVTDFGGRKALLYKEKNTLSLSFYKSVTHTPARCVRARARGVGRIRPDGFALQSPGDRGRERLTRSGHRTFHPRLEEKAAAERGVVRPLPSSCGTAPHGIVALLYFMATGWVKPAPKNLRQQQQPCRVRYRVEISCYHAYYRYLAEKDLRRYGRGNSRGLGQSWFARQKKAHGPRSRP